MYTGNLVKFNKDSTSVRVGTAVVEVFADQPFDFQNLANKQLTVFHGLGDVTTIFNIEASPDLSNWATVGAVGAGTLGTTSYFEVQYTNDSRKYWRVRAAVGTAAPASYATLSAFWRFS